MSGPKADAILAHAGEKKKKRRRKNEDYVGGSSGTAGGSGLVMQDEDERWRKDKDADDDDEPVMGKDVATFKKGASAWATVGASSLALPQSVKEEPDSTDAAAGLSGTNERDNNIDKPKQLTKRRGGLRTAKQMAEADRAAAAARSASPEAEARTQTVHRDQSGRVIDVNELKDKARRQQMEEKLKEEERKEWTKGLVQREQRERRVAEEATMTKKDVAR
jgi:pre-mRNA-splicing factor CWC26